MTQYPLPGSALTPLIPRGPVPERPLIEPDWQRDLKQQRFANGLAAVLIEDAGRLEALAPAWRALLANSSSNEPTLSPEWLLTWWEVFGGLAGRRLCVIGFLDGNRLVGLAPLLRRRWRYWPGLSFRRLEALGSGEDEADSVCSDYLNVLCEQGREQAVSDAFVQGLDGVHWGEWDELILPMMDGASRFLPALRQTARQAGLIVQVRPVGESPYIPLPASWDEYLRRLPGGDRYYLKRSLRDFERWAAGEARFHRVESANDLEQGKRILHELHHERWRGTGSGVFRSARFLTFHDRLMSRLLERDALELLWLSVRGEPVAAMYNLRWAGKTWFYQCGRRVGLPPNIRVGVVLHAHAIRGAIEGGQREYDFLCGACRYKKQLALASRPVVELRLARPSLVETARSLVERSKSVVRSVQGRLRHPLGG
jgi:CelD/BcsL family acetyltransferase involved in cellulose biosynthesis